jgi:phosphoglycerate dehydrogenase-like enzyme
MTGVYERYMAEYVFAHLLSDSQKLAELSQAQSHRTWPQVTTRSLHGRAIGVAGIGFVGREVARIAKTFGMTVKCLGRRDRAADGLRTACVGYSDRSRLHEFLTGLDVLVLTLPATPETDRMFGAKEFRILPRGAVVINVARGQLVDEDGLLGVLRDGHLSRAIIDTFRNEPLPPDSPLWDAPNITVTPHMAGAVYPEELGPVVARNLRSYLSGRIPEPTVDRRIGY